MENLCGLQMGQSVEGGSRYEDCSEYQINTSRSLSLSLFSSIVPPYLLLCVCVSVMSPEQVDILLQHSEGGVDSALGYAKAIAKYMKDIISYVEKRIALGI